MEFLELQGTIRTTTGKGAAKATRREGNIPGIIYSAGKEPVMITILALDIVNCFKKSKTAQVFVNLTIAGDSTYKAMIKDYQIDPISRNVLHVDMLEVSLDKKILVRVPVTTSGKAVGVEYGGTLQIIRRELDILCKPEDVPESVELDITNLEMGDSIHVEEIELEGDMEISADVNYTVLTVVAPKAEVEEEVEEAEESEEGATEEGEKEAITEDA